MTFLNAKKDVAYIRDISDKALDLMSQYNVVPSPANYEVWYDYASEDNMSLNKAIDDMIRMRKSFTAIACKNLHEKFYSNNQEQHAVVTTGQGLQDELTKIAKTVSDVNKGTAKYGISLNESMLNIDNIPEGAAMKTIIAGIMKETKEQADSNSHAQEQLKESAKTVQKLQATLEIVRQEGLTDMLTNIGNRKFFEETLKTTMDKANKEGSELCMVIGDIDHFKKFNDTWGHHVGDQVLKAVAHTLKTRVGDMGSTARYGGEEFVILLPGVDIEAAHDLSDTIRKAIASRNMKRKSTGESIGKITCSFGLAQYRQKEHRNDFLERADAALYRSKSNGRNRVTPEDDGSSKVVNIA